MTRRRPPSSALGSSAGRFSAWLDLTGLLLVAATIGWSYVAASTSISGGSPDSFSALLLGCASALVIGRLLALLGRTLVPAAVVAVAAVIAVRTPDVLSSAPLSGPFGYSNAKGAFFVQAALAGLMLAAASRAVPLRLLGLTAAVAFGVVPFAVESVTAGALLLLLPIAALAAHARRGPRAAAATCALLFMVALAATIAIGSTYVRGDRTGVVDRIVDATLTERRAALWHEALVMMREHLVTGTGPGGFQEFSPTALSDRDARWAHNSFLQQGAESGLIGLILLLLVFMWGFASLWATTTPGAMSVLGAVALAALGIHACIDYVLHFPPVPLTAATLVGAAGATSARSGGRRSADAIVSSSTRRGK